MRPGRRTLGAVGSRGSVTAEMAVALPVLIVLLGFALTAVSAVTAQLRCVDAAREGVRAAARGEAAPAIQAVVRRLSPPRARVTVRYAPDLVTVGVEARLRPFGVPVALPPVAGTAVAGREPGSGP